MMIIGCDFHPSFQQIAFVNKETGEYGERRLTHPEEAAKFYRSLAHGQVFVRGVEDAHSRYPAVAAGASPEGVAVADYLARVRQGGAAVRRGAGQLPALLTSPG